MKQSHKGVLSARLRRLLGWRNWRIGSRVVFLVAVMVVAVAVIAGSAISAIVQLEAAAAKVIDQRMPLILSLLRIERDANASMLALSDAINAQTASLRTEALDEFDQLQANIDNRLVTFREKAALMEGFGDQVSAIEEALAAWRGPALALADQLRAASAPGSSTLASMTGGADAGLVQSLTALKTHFNVLRDEIRSSRQVQEEQLEQLVAATLADGKAARNSALITLV
ncbi:MAG TPA: MCP four helix bundle domain-containing protein, partial [Bacillota bacterium]